MATTIRYSQAGHKFIIDGDMSVGNTITVTVEPLSGYEFISWEDGSTDNPRTIKIVECGVTYVADFEPECNKQSIYNTLSSEFLCGSEHGSYESSTITCQDIRTSLTEIIGTC